MRPGIVVAHGLFLQQNMRHWESLLVTRATEVAAHLAAEGALASGAVRSSSYVVAALVIATLKGDQMATQPPTTKDTPFGLEPNVAAGLAYLFGIIGGIVIYVGGGTNKFVKWAAAQSITLWGAYIAYQILVVIVDAMLGLTHLWILFPIVGIVTLLVGILALIAWLYTFITGFQGKEVRLPIIADLTTRFFPQAS